MSHDAELIAKAISALQPKSDYLKDYVLPFVIALFGALLGGLSAVSINRRQGLKNIARDNFVAANQIFVLAHGCLDKLVAIKSNYEHISSDAPLIRAGEFPTIVSKLDDVKFNAHELYFIRTIPTANKNRWQKIKWVVLHRILRRKIKQPSIDELRKSWRNKVRIGAMFENYNQVMELLRIRNPINERVKEIMAQTGIKEFREVGLVRKILGEGLCGGFVDLTESAISLTDYVMHELHQFLLEFPEIAESNIELSRIKEWGRFPTYHNQQEAFLNCMKPIMKPNYKTMSEYTGVPEAMLKRKYNFVS
ncbi:TPA: hypothetical protein O8L16_000250 [Enterobacter cloacae]|nr:hypothetical protein [Enterobacter cloacae]